MRLLWFLVSASYFLITCPAHAQERSPLRFVAGYGAHTLRVGDDPRVSGGALRLGVARELGARSAVLGSCGGRDARRETMDGDDVIWRGLDCGAAYRVQTFRRGDMGFRLYAEAGIGGLALQERLVRADTRVEEDRSPLRGLLSQLAVGASARLVRDVDVTLELRSARGMGRFAFEESSWLVGITAPIYRPRRAAPSGP